MSAYEMLDEIRDITNCPDGKSITQHVADLRAQVAELKGILAAVDDHWHGGGSKTKELHATVQAARVGATSIIDRATRAEAELAEFHDALMCVQQGQSVTSSKGWTIMPTAVDVERGVAHERAEARVAKLERVRKAAKLAEECEAKCAGKCPALPHEIDAVWADLRAALAECGEG